MEEEKRFEFEPKKTNQFIVRFPEEFNIPKELVSKVNRPIYHTVNHFWESMEVCFHDTITNSVSKTLLNYVNDNVIGRDIDDTVCLFTFYVDVVDPTKKVVETWVINVNNILTVEFPELSYYSDKVSECKIYIKPLSCKLIV